MSGTFEIIKNRLRKHTTLKSAKQAFSAYWTAENLAPERLELARGQGATDG